MMDVSTMYFVAIVVLLLALVYRFFSHRHSYWQNKGIPCAQNCRPIIGHVPVVITLRNIVDFSVRVYKQHPGKSMVGFYNYIKPCLLLRDPELVKKVLITNFANFADNDNVIKENEEPLLAKNPFFTNGAAWKTSRTRLTSSLTGNKLKTYSQMVHDVTEKMVNYVDRHIQKTGSYEVEAKGLFARFTAEVGASVGFGIEGYCFDESKGDDNFTAVGRLFFSADIKTQIKMFMLLQFPWLLGLLKVNFVSKNFQVFFENLVKHSVDSRKAAGTNGKNLIDVIIEQEEKEGDPSTRFRDITSHMLSFLLDVIETSAVTMTFLAYNLAVNKDVQDKVRDEIKTVMDNHKELNYDAINEMVYLEQAMHESLRHFPVLNSQIKCCTQTIELEGHDGLKCVVEPGTRVYIPVAALNSDTRYWDEPQIFRPERFESEEVKNRNKLLHLPFGEGPRMCPGKKIATLMVKMAFAAMLMNFQLELSKKMKLPITLDPFSLLPHANGGMWLNIKKLN